MNKLNAFVGHSFDENDEGIIRVFLDYFDTLKDVGLEWEHAERAEPKVLSEKVREKMEGKNLFIGIFTIKHKQILPLKLKSGGLFNKGKLIGIENDFQWNTSGWIIQESGYALGKGLKLIFLAEKGLGAIGGLQGDLEFIPFSRENPSTCFPKLNEMITALMKGSHETVATEGTKEKPSIQSAEPLRENEAEEKKDLLLDLISAIEKKDTNKEIDLAKKYIDEAAKGDKYEEVGARSFYYWLSYRFGGRDELVNLRKLVKENPEHSIPYIWLGNLYSEYERFDDAAEAYSNAANYSREAADKTKYLCKSANALLKANKNNDARQLLLNRIEISFDSPSELHGLYKEVAEIFLKEGALDQYYSFAEKALKLHPSDGNLRFNLAYTYDKNNKYAQSLYHYNILCSTSPDSANLNNLGVEYTALNMESKAVSAYKRSEEKGGTIAIGNLAQKLIDAGFLEEAKGRLEEALKKPEYDPTIPKALARIEEIRGLEEEKEKATLSSIASEQQFRIDYANAYSVPDKIESLLLKWKSKYGEVEILISDDKFSATGETDMPRGGLASLFNPYRRSESKQDMLKRIVIYTGKVVNKAIDYTLTLKTVPIEERDITSIGSLALTTDLQTYSGQMILDKECKKIFVMEKDSKDNITFYEMTPIK